MSVRLDGKPLRLDAALAPRSARVLQGTLQVFAARLEGDQPLGPRRFLFECAPGDPLVFLPTQGETRHGLIAVGRAEIEAVSEDDASWTEDWAAKLASAFGAVPRPPGTILARPDVERLESEQLLAAPAEGVRWLRVSEGSLELQGLVSLDAGQEAIPLVAPIWLRASEAAALGSREAPKDPLPGLVLLQELLLSALGKLDASEGIERRKRLDRRAELSREASERTVRNLASVLAPREPTPSSAGSPALRAAALVGHALGVEIREPLVAPGEGQAGEGQGVSIEAIAAASHLRIRSVLLRDDWWKEDCGPLLGFMGPERRPVALLSPTPGDYFLVDPEAGTKVKVTARSEGELERFALMLYPPAASDGRTLLRRSLEGLSGDRWRLILGSLVAAALSMILPLAIASIIDDALPAADRPRILELSLVLVLAAFGAAMFRAAAGYTSVRLSTLVDHRLQTSVVDRLLRLPLSFYRRFTSGDLVTRAMGVYEMRARLSAILMGSLMAGLMSSVHLVILIQFGGMLTLLALGVGLASVLFVTLVSYPIRRLSRASLEITSANQGLATQLVSGVTKLRVAGAADRALERFATDLARQQDLRLRQNALRDLIAVMNAALPVASSLLLYALTVYLIKEQVISGSAGGEAVVTPGGFVAFQASFGALIAGMTLLSNSVADVLDVTNLWERARPILDEPVEIGAGQADPGRLRGRISAERVAFRYREGGAAVLDDVTVRAEPGEFIALVGASGCGKSTLLRLLLGLETPTEGSVLYDDQDLSGLDLAAVRRQIGTVLQEGRISAGSILNNVSGGQKLALGEISAAVKAAGLDRDVKDMPMGLHTVISEGGTNLSGGQRQRLLLARALAKRPLVFVLDEATSALDNLTQATVTESLARLNATRIVVAHRLSTIQDADRIYVLDRGRVVQEGSPAQLSKIEGPFRDLVQRQLLAQDPLAATAGAS